MNNGISPACSAQGHQAKRKFRSGKGGRAALRQESSVRWFVPGRGGFDMGLYAGDRHNSVCGNRCHHLRNQILRPGIRQLDCRAKVPIEWTFGLVVVVDAAQEIDQEAQQTAGMSVVGTPGMVVVRMVRMMSMVPAHGVVRCLPGHVFTGFRFDMRNRVVQQDHAIDAQKQEAEYVSVAPHDVENLRNACEKPNDPGQFTRPVSHFLRRNSAYSTSICTLKAPLSSPSAPATPITTR